MSKKAEEKIGERKKSWKNEGSITNANKSGRQRRRGRKVFHVLHQLGGFDNDDARISDLQNSERRGGGADHTAAAGSVVGIGGHIWLW